MTCQNDIIDQFTNLRTEAPATLLDEIHEATCKHFPNGGPRAISIEVHRVVSERISKVLQQVVSSHEIERLIQGG